MVGRVAARPGTGSKRSASSFGRLGTIIELRRHRVKRAVMRITYVTGRSATALQLLGVVDGTSAPPLVPGPDRPSTSVWICRGAVSRGRANRRDVASLPDCFATEIEASIAVMKRDNGWWWRGRPRSAFGVVSAGPTQPASRRLVGHRSHHLPRLCFAAAAGLLVAQRLPAALARVGSSRPDYRFAQDDMLGLLGRAAAVAAAAALTGWWFSVSTPAGWRRRSCRGLVGVILARSGLSAAAIGLVALVPRWASPIFGSILTGLTPAFLAWRLCPATPLALRGANASTAMAAAWRCSGRRPVAAAALAAAEWLPAYLVATSRDATPWEFWHLVLQPWAAWDSGRALSAAPTLVSLAAGLSFAAWVVAASRWPWDGPSWEADVHALRAPVHAPAPPTRE